MAELAEHTSMLVPAYNEAHAVAGPDSTHLKRQAAVAARSSSSTMGRPTARENRRRRAGARVLRHPYNKGNGAAVKTGPAATRQAPTS